jgi:D-alanyl-D-alanine carboxypeptidase
VKKRTFLVLIALLFRGFIFAQSSNTPDFTKIVDSLMDSGNIPELGYAVIKADKILEMKTLGFHRSDLKDEQTTAKLSDYFHLGSNTKAITGFIAAYLVEQNKVKWQTKFFDLLPEMKELSDPAYHNISLADLLSHRAKIQPYTSGPEYKALPTFKGSTAEMRKKFVIYVLKGKAVKNSGELYSYSNAGYSIAALMLEKVSNKTWEDLVDEILHKELQLNYKLGWPNKDDLNQPWGHWIENDKLTALPGNIKYNLALAEPAGDVSMPLLDYAKFIQLNLRGLIGEDNVLKSSTYNYLHYGIDDYAIGWGNLNKDSTQLSEHAGSGGTFYCYTLIDKKNQTAYVIAANTATEKAQKSIYELADRLIKQFNKQ